MSPGLFFKKALFEALHFIPGLALASIYALG